MKKIKLITLFLIIYAIEVFAAGIGDSSSVVLTVKLARDTVFLGEENRVVYLFSWPDTGRNPDIVLLDEPELFNLMEGSGGSRISTVEDSATGASYKTQEFHFTFTGLNPGPAKIAGVCFSIRYRGNTGTDTVCTGSRSFYILPPKPGKTKNSLGWIVVLGFFILNILVLLIFAYRRKTG
jgi:hypothetical protein